MQMQLKMGSCHSNCNAETQNRQTEVRAAPRVDDLVRSLHN